MPTLINASSLLFFCRKMKILFRIFSLFIFCFVFLIFKIHFDKWNMKPPTMPTILIWTNWFSQPSSEFVEDIRNYTDATCLKKCIFTADKNQISFFTLKASAIVFHLRDLNLSFLPPRRFREQYYVLLNYESPKNSYFPSNRKLDFFNLTMTYRIDSDIPSLYDHFIDIEDDDTRYDEAWSWSEVKEWVLKKNETAIQFVSHCNASSKRDEIVQQLLNASFHVDQFGSCSNKACDKKCEAKILPNYYFYLALENSICKDYVTEKFWRIKKLIVPIVFKRSIAASVAPNDSFIAVDDFNDVKDLANYLTYLIQNQKEYLKYFEWTKRYQRKKFNLLYGFCQLCEKFYDPNLVPKQYDDIEKWYNSPGTCAA